MTLAVDNSPAKTARAERIALTSPLIAYGAAGLVSAAFWAIMISLAVR